MTKKQNKIAENITKIKVRTENNIYVSVYGSKMYGGLQVQNKTQFWKQNNKLQTQMQI